MACSQRRDGRVRAAADARRLHHCSLVFGDVGRMLTTGHSNRQRLTIVAHTDRDERIRIISARERTAAERRDYAEETK
jgi:hypothetical protein